MQTTVREGVLAVIVSVFGLVSLISFLIPLVLYRIWNIGNATGIAVSLAVLFYGLCMRMVNEWIGGLWQNGVGKVCLLLVGAVLTAVVVLTLVFSVRMVQACKRKPQAGDTLVVLGCKVHGERASRMLNERIGAAYAYLSEHEQAVCVLSGGQGEGEAISEAECMYRALVARGIAPERLYKEEASTSTRENLKFSCQLIEREGLASQIAIVTNEFHEYRAQEIARGLGLTASAVPARTTWWLFSTFYVRELYGILYQIIL